MTEHVNDGYAVNQEQLPETGVVIVSEDMPKFLKETAEVLENEGEVLVQTSEDVGSETVHQYAAAIAYSLRGREKLPSILG